MNWTRQGELLSDFWWLSSEERIKYVYVDLFHQQPYSDEPNTNNDPLSCPMSYGGRHTLKLINQWRSNFRNTNIFRSFRLYDAARDDGTAIIGPLLLDIDRINETNKGYIPDIDRALEDVRLLVKKYCANLGNEDYRIFFTGHKGFHVEISPHSLGVQLDADFLKNFEQICKDINVKLGNAFVDRPHGHIRFHNSINSWISHSGRQIHSMTFETDISDLYALSAKDFLAKGERLAREELGL